MNVLLSVDEDRVRLIRNDQAKKRPPQVIRQAAQEESWQSFLHRATMIQLMFFAALFSAIAARDYFRAGLTQVVVFDAVVTVLVLGLIIVFCLTVNVGALYGILALALALFFAFVTYHNINILLDPLPHASHCRGPAEACRWDLYRDYFLLLLAVAAEIGGLYYVYTVYREAKHLMEERDPAEECHV